MDKFRVNAKNADDIVSEIGNIYNAIKHNLSYNLLKFTLKLNPKVCQDFSCGRTKSEAFVRYVLGKKVLEAIINNLKQHESPFFFGLQIDASYHKNTFNILIWRLIQ